MKGKRFLSVLTAVMLILALFSITASAATADPALVDPDKLCTINIDLKVAGTPIADAKFKITNSDPAFELELTTDANGSATTGATLAQDTYHVEQTVKGANQKDLAEAFDITLPYTNPTTLSDWKYDITAAPKATLYTTAPTITKKVADEDVPASYGQSASIMSYDDKLAYWKITVNLPENIAQYKKLHVTDYLDERLINFTLLRVVNNANNAELTKDTDFTSSYDAASRKFDLSFTAAGISGLSDNETVDIFFTTAIDLENEKSFGEKIGNHVVLNFTNATDVDGVTDNTPQADTDNVDPEDPDFEPDPEPDPTHEKPGWPTNPGDTPDSDDPYVWTGILQFTKIEKGNEDVTLNPTFKLYNADTDAQIKGDITGTNGVYKIAGLKKGNYYLIETVAPKGYTLFGEKISFSVADVEHAKVAFTQSKANSASEETTLRTFNVGGTNYIVNIKQTDLPLTGGVGVYTFAVIGLAIAAFGGAFLLKTRKVTAD